MDLTRRRIAVLDDGALASSATLHERAYEVAAAADVNPTIAPYHDGLEGVDQPMNMVFTNALWMTLGIMAAIILGVRIIELTWAKLRLVSAMSVPGHKQSFWKNKQWSWMPALKKQVMYAPLCRKRHNREIRLSSAVNMGTLPSRFHAVLLATYLISNLIYMVLVDWSKMNRYSLVAEIRGRSGTLALVSMVPLIILAGRNNPLIALLKVSFDTYNLLHRWMGRVVVLETLIHACAWLYVQLSDGGWQSAQMRILHEPFVTSGVIGSVALLVLLVGAFSPLRHAFYETFLTAHVMLAFIVFACSWVHCVTADIPGGLPQTSWMMAILLLWIVERLCRLIRLTYANWSRSRGFTQAIVEAMPGETTRVTMRLPRHVDVRPGTHAYLRFSGLNFWENHPFSIAWVEHEHEDQQLPISEKESQTVQKPVATTISFIIGAQRGLTRMLYNAALNGGGQPIRMRAAVEGPYAGHHSLDSYGHAVLFAGATGITHQISFLKHLVHGYNEGTVATRRVTLVWIVREYEALEWVRPWMDHVLRMPNRKSLLHIKLFVTRPKNSREIASASSTVQMFPGRPNIPMLVAKEVSEQQGAMVVTVCGPGALADDVRDAVRKVQDMRTVVDFIEESFTW